MSYKVFYGDLLIGRSELETGEPSMCIAVGRFVPNDNFTSIQSIVQALGSEEDRSPDRKLAKVSPEQYQSMLIAYRDMQLNLIVKTETGEVLGASDQEFLSDYSHLEGLDEEDMQIEIFRIPGDLYHKCFAKLIKTHYERLTLLAKTNEQ